MRTRLWTVLVGLVVIGSATAATAQELGEVQTPTANPVTTYRVIHLTMEIDPTVRFIIGYVDNFGKVYLDEHTGYCLPPVKPGEPVPNPKCAEALIMEFNIGDFSTDSLSRRSLQHLMDEKLIPPVTITGTPPQPLPKTARTPVKPVTPVKKD